MILKMSEIFQRHYADLAEAITNPLKLAVKLSSGSSPVVNVVSDVQKPTDVYTKACVILEAIRGRLAAEGSRSSQCDTMRTVCEVMKTEAGLRPLAERMAAQLPAQGQWIYYYISVE